MRPRFRLASAIVALMAAIFVTAPVAATSPWVTFKQVGTSAFAITEECADNADGSVTCVGQFVDVFEGTIKQSGELTRKGEQVCYSDFINTFDPIIGETIEIHCVVRVHVRRGNLDHRRSHVDLACSDSHRTDGD